MTASPTLRGPKGRVLLGHALELSRDPLRFSRACAAEFGDLVPLRFFWKRILLVNHPDDIRRVLATGQREVVKGAAHRTDRLLVGDGLSLSEGDDWRRGRRLMQPAFHRERLAEHGRVVVARAEEMSAAWRDGETRDLWADLGTLTLAIVAETLFGVNVRDDAELARALSSALECRGARARSLQALAPARLPTPLNLRLRRARRRLDRIVDRVIAERRLAADDRADLLSLLLSAADERSQGRTDARVRDEVVNMFVGGTETVADVLAWAWYLLSQHPDVETGLLTELDTVLGERSPTVADLPLLPYAARVVSETLRLYPPASVLEREAAADFDLGGHRVARGTDILVSPWVVHRDPRSFVEPDRFDPDRWADGLAGRLPPYAYLPFGGGSRLCIGKAFATMEAILVLASVARRCRLELPVGPPVVAEPIPTLRPRHGLRMVVHRRQGRRAALATTAARADR